MLRPIFLTLAIVHAFALATAAAVEPQLEQADLWVGGEGDYAIYRIPGLAITARGTVLAYCEARRTGKTDWDTIDLYVRRSADGGRTFDPPRKVADVPGPKTKNPVATAQRLGRPDDVTYNNPVVISTAGGAVHLLFCLEYMRCFAIRSDDDGQTWSAPVEVTAAFDAFRPEYDWKVLATGPGHGIELSTGRLVVPVWLSTGTGGHAHRPSVTATIFSDDGGATWHRSAIAVPDTPEWVNPNETVVAELADGQVMLNVRNESAPNRRLIVTSPDGATGWSTPRFDAALYEPICMASLVRLSRADAHGRNRLVFANPHNLTVVKGQPKPGGKRDRKNLSIKLSYDEGQTWPVNMVLEPGASAYSDLAALADGTMLCLYERQLRPGSKGTPPTTALTLARFNLEWLTDGADRWTSAAP